ncbi:MAG: ATP-binding protein [Planctomycetales bacterium]|nr:ATP-binding protein [Planctomycetales bacterium]
MAEAPVREPFYSSLAAIFNSQQSRSVILAGNVYDLFFDGDKYVPLLDFLAAKSATDGLIRVIYEQNKKIRILDGHDKLKNAWIAWKAGVDVDTLLIRGMKEKGQSELDRLGQEFERLLSDAMEGASVALEVLRQFTLCSRSGALSGNLMIFIEAADMLLPAGDGDISRLRDNQLHRITICQDWFGDPEFMSGGDSVCMVAESRSLIHPRVSRLPQVLTVEIPSPDRDKRLAFIQHFLETAQRPPKLWSTPEELAAYTAGLSLHAVRQLLAGASYDDRQITPKDLIIKVEAYIQSQVGEDVVEFKKPTHTLDDVVGCANLKEFIRRELLVRFRTTPDKALPGAAVAGPIGGGKTFLFEAVAGELGVPVLVLKNIRSQWYGQTDVIFERLRRVLEALEKVVIFVDEADTQFGGVGAETHSTERRLTGKIQAMMSDPQLRGRVMWLLMTARIHLLSPDIRRPGRVGDLIIPVLDPEGQDRMDFVKWMVRAVIKEPTDDEIQRVDELTKGYSAAAFASLRSQLKSSGVTTVEAIVEIVRDHIPPAIGLTRRYQTLQAMVNCTRRSLLPNPDVTEKDREAWQMEIRQLEGMGIH